MTLWDHTCDDGRPVSLELGETCPLCGAVSPPAPEPPPALEQRIADAAAAAVVAILPSLAPHADAAEVADVARAAALDSLDMRPAELPTPPGGTEP